MVSAGYNQNSQATTKACGVCYGFSPTSQTNGLGKGRWNIAAPNTKPSHAVSTSENHAGLGAGYSWTCRQED